MRRIDRKESLSGTTRLAGGFRKNSSFVGVLYAIKARFGFCRGELFLPKHLRNKIMRRDSPTHFIFM